MKILVSVNILILSFSININAQTDVNNAQAIFIYNFLSHIQWPDSEVNNKYIIGFFGNTATYNYFKNYTTGRKVGAKTIEVISIKSPETAINCHVLFVARNKSNMIPEINKALTNKSCLIIGEKDGTTEMGAVIDFHIQNDKLRYRINEGNAKNRHLYISKTLLTMSL